MKYDERLFNDPELIRELNLIPEDQEATRIRFLMNHLREKLGLSIEEYQRIINEVLEEKENHS